MEKSFLKTAMPALSSYIILSLLFLLSGIIGGLFGSGGGILAVFVLKHLIKDKQNEKSVFATSMAIILPMSAISAVIYSKNTALDYYSISHYILPGCAGGMIGAFCLNKIKIKYIDILFSILVILAGGIMILKRG